MLTSIDRQDQAGSHWLRMALWLLSAMTGLFAQTGLAEPDFRADLQPRLRQTVQHPTEGCTVTTQPTHLVVIMADQLRCDALGAHTPNINALAAEGMAFNQAYCASPLCVPARGSFFTGLYPNENGSIVNGWVPVDSHYGDVRDGIPSLYGLLQDGFDSWHTGKQHFMTRTRLQHDPAFERTHWLNMEAGYKEHLQSHGKRSPGGPAFQGLLPELTQNSRTIPRYYSIPTTGCYPEDLAFFYDGYIKDCSLEAIRGRDRDKPFALNAMFVAPHPPLEIPEPWYSQIKAEDVQFPENVGVWADGQSPLQLYNLPGFFGSKYSREDWQEVWRVYLGLVSLLDHCVGEIVQTLKDEGIYDDTLILFTADHGEMLGSHRLWQKMCNYQESIRVPLLFKLPKSLQAADTSGCTSEALVSHIDIVPTLCDLLHLEKPAQLSGRSLVPELTGQPVPEDRDIFVQYDGNGAYGNFSRAILRQRAGEPLWKLNVDAFKDETCAELFNLSDDPQEMHNCLKAHPAQAAELMTALAAHMQRTGDLLELDPTRIL